MMESDKVWCASDMIGSFVFKLLTTSHDGEPTSVDGNFVLLLLSQLHIEYTKRILKKRESLL